MRKDLEEQVKANTSDITHIKHSIDTIKNNHLHHIEKDMDSMNKRVEKMDNRIWWVLSILVLSTVVGLIKMGTGL